ncbi:MAG TPA: LPXTG cell wall anchor domain-containing protein [Actinomycetota bacterium]|nr:LPXTG cell wall anchor domain-containing protein [Actinomycetota bacterium]
MSRFGRAAAIALSVLAVSTTAWAQYPPQNFITVTPPTVVRGQLAIATACCFQGSVTWTAFSHPRHVGTSTAGSGGLTSITWTVPLDMELGDHTLTASGSDRRGRPLTLATRFTVVSETVVAGTRFNRGGVVGSTGGSAGTRLQTTGSNTIPWMLIGIGSVLAGGTMLGVSRRRKVKA